jgi:hypothetical protein
MKLMDDGLPEIEPRRPYDDEHPDGYLESDQAFLKNNNDAAVWFLENRNRLTIRRYHRQN